MCSKRVKYGVTVTSNLCPWEDDPGGDTGGSKGVDRGTQSRLRGKSSLGGKAWLPQRGFATLPPGGREEVCTLTFPPRFQ